MTELALTTGGMDVVEVLVRELFEAAIRQHVSDIYIGRHGDMVWMQLRQVNTVSLWREISPTIGEQVLTYLKFQANMAVSERRRPQVGALDWQMGSQTVECRLSAVGDYAGSETLVIRLIFDRTTTVSHYLRPEQSAELKRLVQRRGLFLFAGPTGSGKTTTMYRLARQLNVAAVVLSIEDPVEIREDLFTQLQVNPAAGMTYSALIKVALRQRPDVLILGEIRDAETASAAINAALSGHLVLSTVHARSAGGTIARLLALGVTGEQLQQVLTAACYQRLIPMVNDEIGVLMDILSEQQLFAGTTVMTEGWRQALGRAEKVGQISAETTKKFWHG